MNPVAHELQSVKRVRISRMAKNRAFAAACWVIAGISVIVLGVLLMSIATKGFEHLDTSFITDPPSRKPEKAGMGPAMWGSIWICTVCAIAALPLGVGTAIFLEEYKPLNRFVQKLHGIVEFNITNLAGVPSIVYGIIGLTVFVQAFDALGNPNEPQYTIGATWYDEYVDESGQYLLIEVERSQAPMTVLADGMELIDESGQTIRAAVVDADQWDWSEDPEPGILLSDAVPDRVDEKSWYYLQLPFGRGVLAGGLTLMLVILPIVIISSQEALRAVPDSLRHGALGLGATKWQMVRRMTLPAAIPGIMTGMILAMSRAIGEAAPVLIIAGIVFIRFTPAHLMDEFTAMPLQIYDWAGRPQEDFHHVASSGIIVLLVVLLSFNALAVLIRHKFQRPMQ